MIRLVDGLIGNRPPTEGFKKECIEGRELSFRILEQLREALDSYLIVRTAQTDSRFAKLR